MIVGRRSIFIASLLVAGALTWACVGDDPGTGTTTTPNSGASSNTAYVTLGPTALPMRLVRDTGFLYFTHNGGIYRVALP